MRAVAYFLIKLIYIKPNIFYLFILEFLFKIYYFYALYSFIRNCVGLILKKIEEDFKYLS